MGLAKYRYEKRSTGYQAYAATGLRKPLAFVHKARGPKGQLDHWAYIGDPTRDIYRTRDEAVDMYVAGVESANATDGDYEARIVVFETINEKPFGYYAPFDPPRRFATSGEGIRWATQQKQSSGLCYGVFGCTPETKKYRWTSTGVYSELPLRGPARPLPISKVNP